MKILVFGSTGATGRHFVTTALSRNHSLVLLVRNPDKLPENVKSNPSVQVIKGDLTDSEAISNSTKDGVDAVICMAGDAKLSKKDKFMFAFVKVLIAAMRANSVRRILYQAGGFSPEAGKSNPFFTRVLRGTIGSAMGLSGFGSLLRRMLADNDAVINYLSSDCSDIDWTVTRPGMLTEGPSKGKASLSKSMGNTTFIDLAAANLDALEDPKSVKTCDFVSYV